MKTYKKIGLGLSAVLLFVTLFIPAMPKQAAAAGPNLNLKFGDANGKTINGSYNNTKFTFNQTQSGVGTYGYTISSSAKGAICSGGFRVDQTTADKAASGYATQIFLGSLTYKPAGSSSCAAYPDLQIPLSAFNTSSSPPPPKSTKIDWSGAKGTLNADGSQITVTFTQGSPVIFKDSDATDSIYNYKPDASSVGSIGGTSISNWCSNTIYTSGGGDKTHGITIDNFQDTTGDVNVCYDNTPGTPDNNQTFSPLPLNVSAYKGPANNGPQQTQCEKNSGGWAFAWGVCPVLEAANGLSTALIDIFEDNLNFNVSQLGTSTDPNSGNYKIHQSWSILKDIASGLVIIIMLIMVLSQAASFGPFDAYTIRKMLPRLVAAVILMQISWPLFNFVIKLVNDLASGMADVMYLPFGGPGQMDLWHLLARAKLSNGLLFTMDWAAIIVFGVLGVAYLFTMLGFALTAIIALFFGVLTLIFRKVLIILLLIFSPVALLAWILPGTKKYWDMWWNNFIKVLFMFPIIVGIIAAGRIFAYVVGTQDNTQFLNLIFVMVGFFGPLFLLPKTYKWGGQAMQMAGNGIMKASSKVSEKPRDFLKHRQQEYSAFRQAQSAQRVYRDPNHRGSILRLDPFKSGRWDPTLRMGSGASERRHEQLARYVERGKKAQGEEVAAFSSMINAETELMNRTQALDHLERRFNESTEGTERWAIAQKIIQLQGFNEIQRIRSQLAANGDYSTWNSIVNGNYDALKGISPHLANGIDGSVRTDADLAALDVGRFAGMKDEELAVMSAGGWEHFSNVDPTGFDAAVMRIGGNASLSGRMAPPARDRFAALMGGAAPRRAAGPAAPTPGPGPGAAPAGGGGTPAGAGGTPGAGPAPTPAPTRPTPGEGAFVPNGELNVPHASPEARVISANATDIDNFVTTSGGWGSLSDGDLYNIYHFRTGEHKAQAARELRNRGIL